MSKSGRPRKAVVHADGRMTIVRHYGRGRKDPSGITIELHAKVSDGVRNGWDKRFIKLTTDELYDLTEALDDLCDLIEDQITEHKDQT